MTAPTHSVIVPVKNGARYIGECLASILAQLEPEDELIVVDNGSTDDTVALVQAVADARLVLLHQTMPGPAAARNTALRRVRGAYVSFQDHDDLWPEGRQQRLLETLRADPTANAAHGRESVVFDGPIDPAYTWMQGQYVNQHSLMCSLFERSLIQRAGLMDESMLRGEDSDYLVRLRQVGMVSAPCDAIVHIRRRHSTNWSSATPAVVRANTLQVLRRNIARRRSSP
jgi:glycosyltransferase involved in cell wall biosynthesis